MNKIPKEFVKYGFNFKQIKRVGDVAIFEQSKPNWPNSYYEVVKIGRHSGYYLGGSKLEPAETYPGASVWGIQGWTHHTLQAAERNFKRVCKRFNKKKELQHAQS